MRNQKLIKKHCKKYVDLMPIGSAGDDGHGIFELGIKQAKAASKYLDRASMWKFIQPAQNFANGIAINLQSERVVNEDVYGARLGDAVLENDGKLFLIFDDHAAKLCLNEVFDGEMLMFQKAFVGLNLYYNREKASTIKELAKKCNLDFTKLSSVISDYNQDCKDGQDKKFNKQTKFLTPIEQGPFYAVYLDAHKNPFVSPSFTIGGLSVNEQTGQVLSAETNLPIENLYAAGRNAAGICSISYVSGLSLADCVFSGRRAAYHITNKTIFGEEYALKNNCDREIYRKQQQSENKNTPTIVPLEMGSTYIQSSL